MPPLPGTQRFFIRTGSFGDAIKQSLAAILAATLQEGLQTMKPTRRMFLKTAGLGAYSTLLATALPPTGYTEPKPIPSSLCANTDTNAVRKGKAAMADPQTYLADLTKIMRTPWPDNRLVNIVCHGHSVPAGYFKTPTVDTLNAYPHLLHKGLKERFPLAVVNVIVTAIGGETSQSGSVRFERDVLTHQPDLITIDYALNDRGLGLEAARNAWVAMIETTKIKNIKLLLLTPTPDTAHRPNALDEELNQHAEQIRGLAKEYNVGLIDSLAAFDKYINESGKVEDLLSQINHPNRKGHDLVTKELLRWFPTAS